MPDPITDVQWGRSNWTDYQDNWREKDAEWLEDRGILRFQTTTARDGGVPTAGVGQVVYNNEVGVLQIKGTSAWNDYKPLPTFLARATPTTDSTDQVVLSHVNASGKGVSFKGASPYEVNVDTDFRVQAGVLLVQSSGVSVKTGTKTAKLTTSDTSLVVDSPVSALSLALTGTGTVFDASNKTIKVGTLISDSSQPTNISNTININFQGTATGGVFTGSRGTFNGVDIGWDAGRTTPAAATGTLFASGGLVSGSGVYTGTTQGALTRFRAPTTATQGNMYFMVAQDQILAGSGATVPVPNPIATDSFYMYSYLRIMQGRGVPWHNAAGTHAAWIAPTVYNATDPGAGNFPDGTIWVS